MFDFIPFLKPQISAVPVDDLIILLQQLFRHCNIVDIGSGGIHCMDKTAARIHAGVALHAEMPLVPPFSSGAFRGLASFQHSWSSSVR